MVKITSILIAALGMAAMGEACKKTCSAVTESGSTCTYNCTDVCSSLPAGTARDSFINALKSSGYSCTASGVTGVKCIDGDEKYTYSQFTCIGTGFSAIALGATLKRWYGITDIRFFEKHGDLGGTWFTNRYPGCACDVPSALYSFSFEPNPSWTRLLPSADELWTYLKHTATKYDLPRKMSFRTQVERCEWIESRSRWRMRVRDLPTNSLSFHESQFLFAGTGQLVTPRDLGIPGLERFKGRVLVPARWPSDEKGQLRGKNVVLFGNGCTAAQIVPNIVAETNHLTQIVRSKHWIMPPIDLPFPKWFIFVLNFVPGIVFLFRLIVFLIAEDDLRGFPMTKAGAEFRAGKRRIAERYMRDTAPEKYHDLLIPSFEVGCKRRIFDCGYLESLHAGNFTLTDAPAVEIVPEGVRLKDDGGVIPADVLILANGYKTNQFFGSMEVVGRRGETVDEHWNSFGGAEAYNSTVMSGFPNFFMLVGPNAITGHTSAVMAAENSVNYSLRIIKPILDGKAKIAELKREAEEEYTDRIQTALQNTVWSSGCGSWYVTDGEDGKQWNAMAYPWSQGYFWYRSLFPRWDDWTFDGPLEQKGKAVKV
ncbi:FAD/NAD(P)-binding domain-containing protein [Poronia punctata]|nr:FAD/NAD(P)-binding domain-containing protein [Poronia punctata]